MDDLDTARELTQMLAAMLPADAALARAIIAARGGLHAAELIRDYYRDPERGNRTPRGVIYFHIGILAGVINALKDGRL